MRLVTFTAVALAAGLGFTGAAARAQAPSAATASPAASTPAPGDDEATTELREHHRHHHHGGVTRFVLMSLDTLGADEAKRPQIEKIQADLQSQLAPSRQAESDLLQTIAAGVAAGNVDKAKVDAAAAKVSTASEGVHAASLDALNKLHATLSPAERAAFVDKVEAHWEVWHQVNSDPQAGAKDQNSRLASLTKRLGLSADQVTKMGAALQTSMPAVSAKFDPKAAEAHVQSFCTAFAGESFDAKAVTANASGHIADQGANRTAVFYETVTPLLTKDQRTKLAEHLREHAGNESATTASK